MTRRRSWKLARVKVDVEGRCRAWREDGCDGDLEAAHVVERRFDPGDEVRQVDIVPLCRVHHSMYDQRLLDLLPYLSLSEQSAAVEKVGLVRALRRVSPTPQVEDGR